MIIITNKDTNVVSFIANDTTDKPAPNEAVTKHGNSNLGTWANGYPVLIEENIAFSPESVNIYQDVKVATEVVPNKYCYTPEQGFYLNPDYVEPDQTNTYGISDEIYHNIIDDYTEELLGGEL